MRHPNSKRLINNPRTISCITIDLEKQIVFLANRLVLNLEFQTKPDENMGFRMLDYATRVYRRFPTKTLHQIVIYLKQSNSEWVHQDSFRKGATTHYYRKNLHTSFSKTLDYYP